MHRMTASMKWLNEFCAGNNVSGKIDLITKSNTEAAVPDKGRSSLRSGRRVANYLKLLDMP